MDIFDVILRKDSNFGETHGYRGESVVWQKSADSTVDHAILNVYFVYGVYNCIFSRLHVLLLNKHANTTRL